MIAQNDIDLRWIINVIVRRFRLIAGCALALAIIAAVVSFATPLKYEASLKLMVEPAKDTRSNEYDTLAAAERLAYTYSQMMKSTNVAWIVIQKLGLTISPDSLIKKIDATPVKDTHLIVVTGVDTSPDKAAALANTFADAFIEYNQEIQLQQYNNSLADNQKTMNDLQSLIQQAQSQIDTLTASRLVEQTELNGLIESQSEYKNEYRALQQKKQDLESKLDQLEDHITVAEPAQPVLDGRTALLNSVIVTLQINPNPVIEGNDYSAILAGEYLATTYGQVLTSRTVVEAALVKVGSQRRYEDMSRNISVDRVPGTLLLELVVSGPNEIDAPILANAIAEEFILQTKSKYQTSFNEQISAIDLQMQDISVLIDQVESDMSTLSSNIIQKDADISRQEILDTSYQNDLRSLEENETNIRLEMIRAADSVIVVESAGLPKSPVQNRVLTIFLAGLLGSMLGVAIVFFLEYLDNKIHTPADVRTILGLNVFGVIGKRDSKDTELLGIEQLPTPQGEQFSILCARIRRRLISEYSHYTLLITSPMPSEGKTYVSANLAIAMANAGLRVVLIDADLRRPRIHQIFGVEPSNGVAEMLLGDKPEVKLTSTCVNGLSLLTGGKNHDNPTQMLNSPQLKKLFSSLKQTADLTIVDCPPVLSFADAQALITFSNGILMVIRSGKTWKKAAQDAKEILEQTKSKLVGVILNDISDISEYNHYYYYGYSRQKRDPLSRILHPFRKRDKELFDGANPQRKKK